MNIGVVDNDELVLGVLSSSLAGAFGRDVVAWRCLSGRRAVSLCLDGRTRPDVLLMDVSLSDMPGIEACRRIRERDGDMPILMITAFPIERYARDAAQAGAQGIVAKRSLRRIRTAIAAVATGSTWREDAPDAGFDTARLAHERLATPDAAEDRRNRRTDLSTRETEILRWYARGLTTRQVSELTGLSANTIKTYTRRAMDKLDAATRGQAIAKLIEHEHRQ